MAISELKGWVCVDIWIAAVTRLGPRPLDLKDIGGEENVSEMALGIVGPGNFVVTALEAENLPARWNIDPAGAGPMEHRAGCGLAGRPRRAAGTTRATGANVTTA